MSDEKKMDGTRFFILSKDHLRNLPIDQHLLDGWKNHPPLFEGKNAEKRMKMLVRKGIPESLRCAIWITSVVRATNPHQNEKSIEDYGTLEKIKILDHGWDLIMKQVFPDASDEADAILYDFGLGKSYLEFLVRGVDNKTLEPIPKKGISALTRVLSAAHFHLDIRYCPLLPHLTTFLLSYMSESYAFATIREMSKDSTRYFPINEAQHYAWCKAFSDMIIRMYPKTAKEMGQNTAISPQGLDPIFKRFFAPILRPQHVLRVMDLYVSEGYKILFRIGITLISTNKKKLKGMHINNAALWWAEIRTITHSPSFDFEKEIIRKAYGFYGSRLRKRVLFPRRRTIARMIKMNELWADDHLEFEIQLPPPKPIGFVEYVHKKEFGHHDDNGEDVTMDGKFELARPASIRASLAQWIPHSLQTCKLSLLFSTNLHGRSLNLLYNKVSKTKRTIMLMEVLGDGEGEEAKVIGLYASQAWHKSNHIYGDGECFLFSMTPEPICYKWRPRSAGSIDDEKNEALMEQFMISKDSFLAMGGNRDGSSGLRLNEDLTKGESNRALGFDNEPLAGNEREYFQVGLVEVYRFVRAVDGLGVDGEDDEVWLL